MTINNKNINNVFYIFVTAHLIFWTLIPSLTNHNLPLDTIEALAWGSNLDWGFNKHPPLSAFFPEVFYQIFGSQDWVYYLLSQIFVIISFYYIFKFSNEIFNNKNIDNVFYIFVTAHLIFWTLIPSITNHNLPLDTIEHLAWGSNLDWGYSKHPPMVAIVLEIFYQIFGSNDWAFYLLSQIFVIIAFI